MLIRAIIGTAAILAGFAVLESTVDASTGAAGACKATQAYATLHPGERIVVRAQPTPEADAVGTLSAGDAADLTRVVVTMNSSLSGWARIALKSAKNYSSLDDATPRALGWIPADLLAVDSRVDGAITTYDRPGLLGSATGTIVRQDIQFRVLGCRGELLQVINASQGNTWIDKWCALSEGCRG